MGPGPASVLSIYRADKLQPASNSLVVVKSPAVQSGADVSWPRVSFVTGIATAWSHGL